MTKWQKPVPQRLRDRQSGAALIVLVLAFTLIALAIVGGMRFWGPKDDLRRASQNGASNRVAAAINAYVTSRGQLPCPDVTGAGASPSPNSCGTASTWGLVPWQTLGLSPQDAVDAWGRRLTYALATNNNGTTPYVCNMASTANSGGGLATWSNLTRASGGTSAAYLLVNHGPNGRGAFLQNGAQRGSQIAVPPTADEAHNCPRDVAGAACGPSSANYWPGPYQSSSGGSDRWFDDVVTAQNSQPFACLCTEPTISGTLDPATGSVKVSASLTAPQNCNAVWTTNIGSGAHWSTAGVWSSSQCSGPPTTTPAGQTCTISATLTATDTVYASNQMNAGWQNGQPASPSDHFTIIPPDTQYTTGTNAATQVQLNAKTRSASDPTITSYTSDSNGGETQPPNGTQTLTYTYLTSVIKLTGSGILCYESIRGTLGILHTDGTTNSCYIGGSDTLKIELPVGTAFASFSLLLYAYQPGVVTVTETRASNPVCTASTLPDMPLIGESTVTACIPSSVPPATSFTAPVGYVAVIRQSVTQKTTVEDSTTHAVLSGPIYTTPLYDALTIGTDTSAQVGAIMLIASP